MTKGALPVSVECSFLNSASWLGLIVMEISGAEMVVRCLQEEKVEFVFGYPGGAVLEIYDAIFKQDKFKHVLVRHEQGAIHAADGYSRCCNKIGVALVNERLGAGAQTFGLSSTWLR